MKTSTGSPTSGSSPWVSLLSPRQQPHRQDRQPQRTGLPGDPRARAQPDRGHPEPGLPHQPQAADAGRQQDRQDRRPRQPAAPRGAHPLYSRLDPENNLITKVENVYGLPSLKEIRLRTSLPSQSSTASTCLRRSSSSTSWPTRASLSWRRTSGLACRSTSRPSWPDLNSYSSYRQPHIVSHAIAQLNIRSS